MTGIDAVSTSISPARNPSESWDRASGRLPLAAPTT